MAKDKDDKQKTVKPQVVILTQNKVCKNCVRFGTTEPSDVASSLYLNNPAHKALGSPKSIRVEVSVG